jgi:NadR type nicotinamide-nucleotide adenylyltransferase
MQIKKVVIIGPESTGKSTLSGKLSAHYKSIWVEEYAREYLLKNGTTYTFENLLDVAKGQLQNENTAVEKWAEKNAGLPGTSPVFIDTDMYVMKVWCEFVFNKCHQWILNQVISRKYDLYLLCNTDVPWVKDELREYPDPVTREKLYHHYKDIMINQNVPWIDICGNYEDRFKKATTAVDQLLAQ